MNSQGQLFGRIAVLMGGYSAERDISLQSGHAILTALLAQGIEAIGIDTQYNLISQLQTGKFDGAFIALHGRGGEDGEIQGLLSALDIPFTGSDVIGAALSINKQISKQLWLAQGLSTPDFEQVTIATEAIDLVARLGLPLVIKPVQEGSSLGMSKVSVVENISAAIATACQFDAEVIAEKWITGKEYTVAILGDEALPVIRLSTPREFYDFEAKYTDNTTEYACPCGLSDEDETACQTLALQAFKGLRMQGWGRVDVMRDMAGQFYLLEANSVPGMTDHSLVPMAAKASGIDSENLVRRILTLMQGGVH